MLYFYSILLPIRPIMRTYRLRYLVRGCGQLWENYLLYKQARILQQKIYLTKKALSIGFHAMEAMVLEVMFAVTRETVASL